VYSHKYHKPTSKWGNTRVVVDGERFDSKLEYERYLYLCAIQKRGEIFNLRRQVSFQLTRRRFCSEPRTNNKGKKLKPRLYVYELASHYVADFVYQTIPLLSETPVTIVEDAKGSKTVEYILKRKMMLELHNIPVMEVKSPCEPIPTLPEIEE